jgi:hypothetical protein
VSTSQSSAPGANAAVGQITAAGQAITAVVQKYWPYLLGFLLLLLLLLAMGFGITANSTRKNVASPRPSISPTRTRPLPLFNGVHETPAQAHFRAVSREGQSIRHALKLDKRKS